MKKIIYLLLTGILFWSCGSADDAPPIPEKNQAPSAVSELTYPTDNLLCSENELNFQWGEATDPNNDVLSYIVEISTDDQFTTIETHNSSSTSITITLDKGKAYYWRVKAKDKGNLSSPYSSVFKFYTEGTGETNHLPFSPELISPSINESVSGSTINLNWRASDVDGDNLMYDVFLDTTTPPTTKVGDNINQKPLEVNITTGTTYYWQVIVKDGNGGESIGAVWTFNTN